MSVRQRFMATAALATAVGLAVPMATAAARPAPDRHDAPVAPTPQPAPPDGPGGTTVPDGAGMNGNVGARARMTSPMVAKHGTSTDIALTGGAWTQAAGELELLAGTMVIHTPTNCTGGFGNALTLAVDGTPATFAAAPAGLPGSGGVTTTVPFLIGTLAEPGRDSQHQLTAKFGNACTKAGEDFTIKSVQVDVLKFH